jgi:hypothetical protein
VIWWLSEALKVRPPAMKLPGLKSPEFKAYLKTKICVNCGWANLEDGIVNACVHCTHDDTGVYMNNPACKCFKEAA